MGSLAGNLWLPDEAPETLSNVLRARQPLDGSSAAGARQPASFGLAPHSASQNPDLRQERTRGVQRSNASGTAPKLTFRSANRARAYPIFLDRFSSVRAGGTPFSREWDTPRMSGRKR